MRTQEILINGFQNICTLQRYLYGNPGHTIELENAIQVTLHISMDDNGNFLMKNTNFPEFEPTSWTPTTEDLLCAIDQLQEQPAKIHSNDFKNRWDEIKAYTAILATCNHIKHA